MSLIEVLQPAPGVIFAYGSHANWGVIVDGDHATLIDSGYPRDVDDIYTVLSSLSLSPSAVVGAVLTHGHTDHQGGIARLHAAGHHFPVYAHHAEHPNIRREVVEQVTVRHLGWHILQPRVTRWALAAIRAGGLDPVALSTDLVAVDDGDQLDLPGSPVIVAAHGHTSGHIAVSLPDRGVLFTGDALVTGHPTLRTSPPAPTSLPGYFHTVPSRAPSVREELRRRGCPIMLPGHGPAMLTRDEPSPVVR